MPYSVAKSCPTLCDPMHCSLPGSSVFSISWTLPKLLMSTEPGMLSNHLILCPVPFCLQSFPASVSFLVSQLFTLGGQSIGVYFSISTSNEYSGLIPLGLTGLISLQSRGLSRVLKSISSSALSFLYSPTLTSIHDYWRNHGFD